MRFLTNNSAHLVPSKGRSSTCVRYLLVRRRRICARGSWTRVGPPSGGYPPTHRTRPDVQSHIAHAQRFVCARTHILMCTNTCRHVHSVHASSGSSHTSHPPINTGKQQTMPLQCNGGESFYLLIDIGHKYFGSCENVAVVKVNYLLRGGLSTGIWTNCVQIWDKIRDGGSIYIADDSAPSFFLIAFGW